ncbi:MAG: hypothetical protein WA786_02670 [Acidimicrobiales bacterium]
MVDEGAKDNADDELESFEVETVETDGAGNTVIDDVVVITDHQGHVVVMDEIIAVVDESGDAAIDEVVSMVGDDGELHVVQENVEVIASDEKD